METVRDGLPVLAFADAAAFSRWLEAAGRRPGAWLRFAKRGVSAALSKREAIDCALCQGWIDGQLARLDQTYFLSRFTPRRPRSRWSAQNVSRAEALLAQGRVQPRGLAEIEAAKADGRWAAAYPSASQIAPPQAFLAALRADARAAENFAALDGANRYAVLYRLHHAAPQTLASRIDALVAMLARGETFHPARAARRRRLPA